MNERSVQLVGGSTYTLSLPKGWINRHAISPKSKLVVVETKSGNLIVVPPTVRRKTLEIKIGEDADKAVKLVTAAYLNGYDRLVILGDTEIDELVRSSVRKILRRLMGFEVTKEGPTVIEVEIQVEPKMVSPETGLERMKNLVLSTLELGFTTTKPVEEEVLEQIDEDSDRLNLFYSRILRQALSEPLELTKLNMDTTVVFDSLMVFRMLERCVDHAASAAKIRLLDRESPRRTEDTKKMATAVGRALEQSVKSFLSKDAELAASVAKKRWELRTGILDLPETQKASLLHYHLGRIVDYSSDIAELVLDEGYGFMDTSTQKRAV
jgi:phosphate uptake regulator